MRELSAAIFYHTDDTFQFSVTVADPVRGRLCSLWCSHFSCTLDFSNIFRYIIRDQIRSPPRSSMQSLSSFNFLCQSWPRRYETSMPILASAIRDTGYFDRGNFCFTMRNAFSPLACVFLQFVSVSFFSFFFDHYAPTFTSILHR